MNILIPRETLQSVIDLLKENLAAFGPCDHDYGICNCDISDKINALEALLAAPCEPASEPLTVTQISEALRQHGLTLVKTVKGYDVMKLGTVVAHNIRSKE
jgi:hypothetical protein